MDEPKREFNASEMELARRVYDENRMYVPIAPGMQNQIYRCGLLPKKTLDGSKYIRSITGSKNYYKDSRTNTPRGSIIIHRDDEDPNPGNCAAFIHPAYGSVIEYRGEKDAEYHASISLSKLHSGINSCGFCAVLYKGVQSKRYMWILSWARFQWLNSHSSDGITYKEEGNPWMHEYEEEITGIKEIDESEINAWITFPKGNRYVKLHLTAEPHPSPSSKLRRPLIDIEYYTSIGKPNGWAAFGKGSHISPDLFDDGLPKVKSWIEHCIDNHEICHFSNKLLPRVGHLGLPPPPSSSSEAQSPNSVWRTSLSSWIRRVRRGKAAISSSLDGPARFIHVTLESKQQLPSVKLVQANSTQPYQYVALSHCWRFSHPLRTTTKNIQAHESNIPLSSMSPVLREAIILAAALQYEYVWIDSLCIIQDDKKDWEKEAPKMGSVYGHATVVFAAHGSNMGIEKIPPVEILDPTRPGNSPTFAREMIDHKVFFSAPENPNSWFGRGWCLQERFFAPRIVHFGGAGEELYFECNSGMECECGHISEGDNCNLKARIATALLDIQPPIDYSFACDKLWKDYIDVCEDYTSRGLAFATDALPAVSSLMRFFAPYLGAYYAGLWEKHLIPSLGWEVLCTPMSKRTESYVAPSFSWASRTGPVIWYWIFDNESKIPTPETYHFAQVVDVSCTPATNDPFGQIVMGHITLRGFTTQMTIESTDINAPDWRLKMTKERVEDCYVTLDTIQDLDEIEPNSSVICLDIMRDKKGADYVPFISGLVLLLVASRPGCHRRIGFSTMKAEHFEDSIICDIRII